MPEITVNVGGRPFQIVCNDGEEPQLQAAAKSGGKIAAPFGLAGRAVAHRRARQKMAPRRGRSHITGKSAHRAAAPASVASSALAG